MAPEGGYAPELDTGAEELPSAPVPVQKFPVENTTLEKEMAQLNPADGEGSTCRRDAEKKACFVEGSVPQPYGRD